MPMPRFSRKQTKAGACPLNGIQKFGFIAIVFFTVKGLLWLLIPALIAISL